MYPSTLCTRWAAHRPRFADCLYEKATGARATREGCEASLQRIWSGVGNWRAWPLALGRAKGKASSGYEHDGGHYNLSNEIQVHFLLQHSTTIGFGLATNHAVGFQQDSIAS